MKFLNSLLFLIIGISYVYSQNYQDCNKPFVICDLATYQISDVKGVGEVQDVTTLLSCTANQHFKETNSFWIEWKASSDGVITFVIDPTQEDDDIDFVLFKKGSSCSDLEELRCMASGSEIGSVDTNKACKGSTGLNSNSIDHFEVSGCKYADDNYLKFLSVQRGEHFALLVNNYNSSAGFTISFEGTATLEPTETCKTDEYIGSLEITNIFPNPATNSVNVYFQSQDEDVLELEIMDFSGKKFFLKNYEVMQEDNTIKLNVKDIPSGSYLIRLSQGNNSTVKQFIKA